MVYDGSLIEDVRQNKAKTQLEKVMVLTAGRSRLGHYVTTLAARGSLDEYIIFYEVMEGGITILWVVSGRQNSEILFDEDPEN